MTDIPNTEVAREADDVPAERPIRVIMFGGQFVSTDDNKTLGLSAYGPDALQTPAMRLFQSGFDPERPLILFRGGRRIGRTTIGHAALVTRCHHGCRDACDPQPHRWANFAVTHNAALW